MVFGSLRRPVEEKGIDLSKVKSRPSEVAKAVVTDEEIEQLVAVTNELGAKVGRGRGCRRACRGRCCRVCSGA